MISMKCTQTDIFTEIYKSLPKPHPGVNQQLSENYKMTL